MVPERYAMLAGCITRSWNANGSRSKGQYARNPSMNIDAGTPYTAFSTKQDRTNAAPLRPSSYASRRRLKGRWQGCRRGMSY